MAGKEDPPPRARILEAAVQLFARYGLDRTTLADVAQRAHLSKATLYHHFPDGKASIFNAAIEGIIERLWEQVEAQVEASSDPEEQLFTYLRLRIETFDKQMMVWGLDRAIWSGMKPWAEGVLERYFERERDLLVRLLETARARGVVRPFDVEIAARMLQATLRGLTVDGPIETKAIDRKHETEEVLAFFKAGLFVPASHDREKR
jgi:AcrR family transcriptional regulator